MVIMLKFVNRDWESVGIQTLFQSLYHFNALFDIITKEIVAVVLTKKNVFIRNRTVDYFFSMVSTFFLGRSMSVRCCRPRMWNRSLSQKSNSIFSNGLSRPEDKIILYSIVFNRRNATAACLINPKLQPQMFKNALHLCKASNSSKCNFLSPCG